MTKNAEGEYYGSVQVNKITLRIMIMSCVSCVYVYVLILYVTFWGKIRIFMMDFL